MARSPRASARRRDRAQETARFVTMRLPELAQQMQRRLRQRHIAVFGALAVFDMHQHALTVNVADVQPRTLAYAQAAGIDGGQTGAMAIEDPEHRVRCGCFRGYAEPPLA